MKNLMEHKGYYGSVEYCTEDDIFYGKAVNVRGLISYEGENLIALKLDFEYAIDDYLLACEQLGKEPMKPNGQNQHLGKLQKVTSKNPVFFTNYGKGLAKELS